MAAARAGAASAESVTPVGSQLANAGESVDPGSSTLPTSLAERLKTLASIAARLGARRLQADALALADRARTDRFYVAVVGQFKRGKSSVINALIGEAVLPTGILPVTAVPVVLRYGPRAVALVRTASDGAREAAVEELAGFISEEHNRENRLGVESVELLLPCPILERGLCLVDTPGLGSAFPRTTEAVRAFVPHIDAAIVVTGSDPPLTGDELAAVEAVSRHSRHLLVVLNKADRATAEEIATAAAFTERMLSERLGRPVEPVLEVSAAEVAQSGPTRDWARLVESLTMLEARAGQALAVAGVERGAHLLFDRCVHELDLARNLAMRPVTEADGRLQALADAAADVALDSLRQRGELERRCKAAVQALAERRASFLKRATPASLARLRTELPVGKRLNPAAARREALRLARGIASQTAEQWLHAERSVLLGILESARSDFGLAAHAAVRRLSELAGTVRISPPDVRWPFDEPRTDAGEGPGGDEHGTVLEYFAPWRWTRRSVTRRAGAELERCLVTAAARAHGTLALAVHELRADVQRQVESAVHDFNDSVEWARALARDGRRRDEVAERLRLEEIMAMRREVQALRVGR